MNNIINVCYAPDNNFVIPCAISIHSLLRNTEKDISIHIYILNGELTKDSCKKLQDIVDIFQNAKIIFIPVEKEKYDIFYTDTFKTATAYRLGIGDLIKNIDKILYLDCDTLIQKSIKELYEIDLENNILGLVPDIWYKSQLRRFPNKQHPYFNAGVCLFDLRKWRDYKCEEKIINDFKKNKDKYVCPDQDPINVILDTQIKELAYKYNWCWHWEKNEYFEDHKYVVKEDAVVIHFQKSKPWASNNRHILSNKYFEEINEIPQNIRMPYKEFKVDTLTERYKALIFFLFPIYTYNYYNRIDILFLNIIPILRIKIKGCKRKYYLFNLIPILKTYKKIYD